MKEGRKPEYSEKTPDDELQKMPHTVKADVLTVTPRVAQGKHLNHDCLGGSVV